MNTLRQFGLCSALLFVFLLPGDLIAGDAEAGKSVFRSCAACHSIEKDVNRVGPSLFGVFGRTPGTLESFSRRYSPAMKAFGEARAIWDDSTLDSYLTSPRTAVPKNRMGFPGLKDATKRADLIAYLKTLVEE